MSIEIERALEILGDDGYGYIDAYGDLIVAVCDDEEGGERSAGEALDDSFGGGTAAELTAAGFEFAWTGSGNCGADGRSTSDISIRVSAE